MTVLLASNGRRRQVEVVYMWTCYPLTQDELSCLGRDLCQHKTGKPYISLLCWPLVQEAGTDRLHIVPQDMGSI